MTADRISLAAFIERHKVRMIANLVDRNPNMDEDHWSARATHWKCVLRCGRRSLTTFFSQGEAHSNEPTAADLLDCLASDSAGVENAQGFEDWCSDYGSDPDSRKAERTYKTCERQAQGLKRLLGEDAYKQLLWDTERL